MDFTGKVAIVTGAGNGIGRSTALAFAARGARVVSVDRDGAAAKATADTITQRDGTAIAVTADVAKSADVQAYVKAALDAWGRIDCFFNNAGIEGDFASIVDYDEATFDRIVGVNLKGVFLGMKHVLAVMKSQGSGAIVNTASVAGLIGSPGIGPYVATKHAVIGLTKSASGEVARFGVRVNAVCPGPVETRMMQSLASMISPDNPDAAADRFASAIPLGRYATTDEIANTVLFLCSDLASGITGAQYVIDGGRTATGGVASRNNADRA